MNRNYNLTPDKFATATRFENEADLAAPARGRTENELERLKERLLAGAMRPDAPVKLDATLRQAADEAAALVWLTPYPLLLLPALFEEKAEAARQQAARQARIRRRSGGLLTLAE